MSFEAPAADTRLVIPSRSQRSDEIQVGLSWSEGFGKYKLIKVITLTPRFILKNNLSEAISFREHSVAPRGKSTLQPGERHSLHFIRMGEHKLLTIAVSGLNAQWYISSCSTLLSTLTFDVGHHRSMWKISVRCISDCKHLESIPQHISYKQT